MTTITANYSWQMPDPGGSANSWGNTLNATTQAIDAQVHTNQLAITAGQAPIGSIDNWRRHALPPSVQLRRHVALDHSLCGAVRRHRLHLWRQRRRKKLNLPRLIGCVPLGYGPGWAIGATGGGRRILSLLVRCRINLRMASTIRSMIMSCQTLTCSTPMLGTVAK